MADRTPSLVQRAVGQIATGNDAEALRLLNAAADGELPLPGSTTNLVSSGICERRVAPLVEQRLSFEEIVAARPTADLDPRWGRRLDRFLPAIYLHLIGQ